MVLLRQGSGRGRQRSSFGFCPDERRTAGNQPERQDTHRHQHPDRRQRPQGLDVAGQSVHAESREPPGHHADAQADHRGNGGGQRQDHRDRFPWLGRGSGEGRREESGWLAVWRSG